MSHVDFSDSKDTEWFRVARFSELSAISDAGRAVLEAINAFFVDKEEGKIANEGTPFLNLGHIVDIVFIPDMPSKPRVTVSDGIIAARRAPLIPE